MIFPSGSRRRRAVHATIAATACAGALSLGLPARTSGLAPLSAQEAAPHASAVDQLRQDLDRILSAPAFERATWGVAVRSLAAQDTLYALNARKLLMPASNMKVLTLAAAAERLGWDFTYETRLATAAPVRDGVLDGDLVVVGAGDPSIDDWDGAATRLFQSWVDELKAQGIRAVSGRLVGDDREFDGDALGVGWAWDDLDNSYGTGVGALQFNENTARLLVVPGASPGLPADVSIQQPGSGLSVRGRVTTTAAGTPASIATRRLVGSGVLDVFGSVPVGRRGPGPNVSVTNPTIYFLTALQAALASAGIEIRGGITGVDAATAPPDASLQVFASHRSPPLSELAATMMKNSQNLYAETLLRTLGGQPATLDGGRRALQAVLQEWGVHSTADLVVADGSGLSRDDLVTPEAMLTILAHVAGDEQLRGPFQAALPVAGVDGTLAQRMKGTPAAGNVRAKTGSFSNARAIAGYVTSADGEPLVFSIEANNFGVAPSVVERAEDAIVVRLARFSRR